MEYFGNGYLANLFWKPWLLNMSTEKGGTTVVAQKL